MHGHVVTPLNVTWNVRIVVLLTSCNLVQSLLYIRPSIYICSEILTPVNDFHFELIFDHLIIQVSVEIQELYLFCLEVEIL